MGSVVAHETMHGHAPVPEEVHSPKRIVERALEEIAVGSQCDGSGRVRAFPDHAERGLHVRRDGYDVHTHELREYVP
jgi:hypothetical protein